MRYDNDFKISSPPKEQVLNINFFKGLQLSVNNTQIDDNASPDMLNMLLDDKGTLNKRPGLVKLNDTLGTGKVTGMMTYNKSTGDELVFGHDTSLYKLNSDGSTTELYTSMSGNTVRGITFNDKLYMLDGTNYLVYDGNTVSQVEGYVPTITINTPPEGGGTSFEQLNLISSGFRQLFNGDGATTTFVLAQQDLDATAVEIIADETTLTEDTDFTVDRTAGTVDFSTGTSPFGAPADGLENVEITAYKTQTGHADKIKKCTFFGSFGGTRDWRLFVAGNPDEINYDYRSELYAPDYFPANGFDEVGSDAEPIVGYSYMYDRMIIIKEESVYSRTYSTSSDGTAIFKSQPLNRGIGALNTDNIALIEGFPTFLSRNGVYQLISISQENERTVNHISNDIDKSIDVLAIDGLLQTDDLEDHIAIDFDSKYWIFNPNNGEVWVYDYRFKIQDETYPYPIGQWFKLDNMYTSCYTIYEDSLYIGDSREGIIRRLNDPNELAIYNDDDDVPINAYWRSKVFDFGAPSYEKLLYKLFYTLKPSQRSESTLKVRDSVNSVWREISSELIQMFRYTNIQYSLFTYGANIFPERIAEKIKAKKISYFQLELSNNEKSSFLGIIQVALNYILQREVK